ncbi:hypothetical protein CDAR_402841 [Caerostris darwini]|uniref:Uncharacterized protein n=1 Tax=Caerostris darwini TaxID=1538125 RepID=A0AAV4VK43_9ARAC|nr:hypothetical protein CDAR_402841 [Caerostris darwini]
MDANGREQGDLFEQEDDVKRFVLTTKVRAPQQGDQRIHQKNQTAVNLEELLDSLEILKKEQSSSEREIQSPKRLFQLADDTC